MTISSSLYSSRSEEWSTPQDFFAKLNHEFRFTLDPCASPQNAKCRRFFTKKQNGLVRDWSGERVFLNPPYGYLIGYWLRKAREESVKGALVVCLVHARTDTRWWHENVQNIADEVRFVKGRLKFESPTGKRSSAPFPSAVVIYRPRHEAHVANRVDPLVSMDNSGNRE
jgi:phage N-6-adenine-methyltransferase